MKYEILDNCDKWKIDFPSIKRDMNRLQFVMTLTHFVICP